MAKHKMSKSVEYRCWLKMRDLVENPHCIGYKKYGGKGVSMCEEWQDFLKFLDDMGYIPPLCNGLKLKEGALQFNKQNCEWALKKAGRKKRPEEFKIKHFKGKHRKVNQSKTICLILENDLYRFIERQAFRKSMEEGKLIEANDMIRAALWRAFPAPTQVDMFGESLR